MKSKDTEVLGGLRARPNEINARSSRPTKELLLRLCITEMLHNTIAQRQFCYCITVQMRPSGGEGDDTPDSNNVALKSKCLSRTN